VGPVNRWRWRKSEKSIAGSALLGMENATAIFIEKVLGGCSACSILHAERVDGGK
jgi:hypothetical protein